MTDKNLNEDNSNLIRNLNSTFSTVTKQEGLVSAEQIKLAQQIKEKDRAQQDLADEIHSSIISLTGFSRSLANNASGDFNVLNKTIDASTKIMGGLASMIPYVGGALDGLIKGAGEVTKFMITTFAKAYGNFEQLSDTGVIATFQDLKLNSNATGLTFADTTKVMGKYSKELAVFSGSAMAGAKRFQNIANNSKLMSEEFQKIGISISDVTDYQLNYINQQTLAGRSQTMTDKQLQEGSKVYIEQLDTLAKLTGKTRKELQDEVNERMKDARYVAAIASLPDKLRNVINGVLSNVGRLGPGISEALGELVANAGVATSEDAKALRLNLSMGGVGPQFYKDLKDGKYSADEANKIIRVALGKYAKSQDSMSLQAGSETQQTRFIVEAKKAAILDLKQYVGQQDDIAKNRQKVIDTTDDANDAAAKTRRNLYGTTRNIDALATESDVMTKIMGGLASGLDKVTEELYNFIGDDLPEYIKLRREENKKQTELNGMRRDLNKKLELEAKLKTLDPGSKEAIDAKDKLATIRTNNINWFKTLEQQVKITEEELRQIQTRKTKAEQAALGSSSGASDSPAPGAAASGQPPTSAPSGSPDSPAPGASTGQPGSAQPTTPSGSSTPGTPGSPTGQDTAAGQTADTTSSGTTGGTSAAPSGGGDGRIVKVLKSGPGGITVQLADGSVVDRTGTVAWRGNNPGNLRYAKWEDQFNAIGIQNAGTSGQFSVFATLQDGINAQKELIFNKYANLSIAQLMQKYDAATAPRYTQIVSQAAGVAPNTAVKNLSPDQREKLIAAIHRQEGFRAGNVKVVSGPTQPTQAAMATAPTGADLGTSQAAVVSGPSTGFSAVLTGNTMVIPANSGSEASALTQQTGSNNRSAVNTFMMMSQKLDQMIDVSNTNLRNTRNAVNV